MTDPSTTHRDFAALHRPGHPFLLGNAWDAASARAADRAGVPAVGSSSAAIAAGLGVPDGRGLNFERLRPVVASILGAVTVPVSVDLEAGYSDDPAKIAKHVLALHRMGVVGINLEDSVVDPHRRLKSAEAFAAILGTVRDHLDREECPMFINVRTDAFVLDQPDALAETLRRLPHYEAAGADGLFVPGIREPEAIAAVVEASALPVNVMTVPGLPDLRRLAELGVARVSLGNFVHERLMRIARETLERARDTGNFEHVF